MVLVLRATPDDAEALQNVYDVIDASALDSKLFRALIKVEDSIALDPVVVEESATELS